MARAVERTWAATACRASALKDMWKGIWPLIRPPPRALIDHAIATKRQAGRPVLRRSQVVRRTAGNGGAWKLQIGLIASEDRVERVFMQLPVALGRDLWKVAGSLRGVPRHVGRQAGRQPCAANSGGPANPHRAHGRIHAGATLPEQHSRLPDSTTSAAPLYAVPRWRSQQRMGG
jgi:hypothetical protein